MAVPFLACMAAVAAFYHLPPRVLPSIQAVEGGRAGLIHHNADGSDDFGVMQVNTVWIGPLSRYAGLSAEATRQRLIDQPCFNIAAAGAILRTYMNEAHGNLMAAVGDYHSHTPSLNQSYRVRVIESATQLFVRRPAAAVSSEARASARSR